MTNLEWYKEQIKNMDSAQLGVFVEHQSPWCDDNNSCEGRCVECATAWFTEKHKYPMPELQIGMFVRAQPICSVKRDVSYLGIIVKDVYDNEDLAIAYADGAWDKISNVAIKAIYNTTCFNCCCADNVIWMDET